MPGSRSRKPLRCSRRSMAPCGPVKSSWAAYAGYCRVSKPRKNSRLARMNAIEAPFLEAGAKPLAQGGLIEAASIRPDLDDITLRPAIDLQSDLEFGMAHAHLAAGTLLAHV